jgi:TPR repeat protein
MNNINRIVGGLALCVLAVAVGVIFWKSEKPQEYVQSNASYALNPEELASLKSQAEGGDSIAAIRLAKYHDFIVLDKQAAIQWWKVAAKLGDVNAQYTVGLLLVDSADRLESEDALKWLRAAAQKGDKSAAKLLEAHTSKQPFDVPAR